MKGCIFCCVRAGPPSAPATAHGPNLRVKKTQTCLKSPETECPDGGGSGRQLQRVQGRLALLCLLSHTHASIFAGLLGSWLVRIVALHLTLCFLQVDKLLGSGSYGRVYKVQRLADGKTYALKQMSVQKMSASERQGAMNEASKHFWGQVLLVCCLRTVSWLTPSSVADSAAGLHTLRQRGQIS